MRLSCQAAGGSIEDAMDAAAAVELLHTFTLVHDDIMDHDDSRRGNPSVHIKWEEATAILAGDGLVALSFQTLLRNRHPRCNEVFRKFTDGLLILCEGQAYDKIFETKDKVSLDEYNHMIACKTARLIQVSCECGAILGNGSGKEVAALGRFAHELGMAFQIQDDLLDILSDDSVSGKPQGSDLIQKKKTFPVIHFYEHASPEMRASFQQYWNMSRLGKGDILAVKELFEISGSIAGAERIGELHISNAVQSLDALKPSQAVRDLSTFA